MDTQIKCEKVSLLKELVNILYPFQDTLQFMMGSMRAQIESLQHELCVLRDSSSERIHALKKRVKELEKENTELRDQSNNSSIL